MPSVLQLTLFLLASGVAGVLIFRYFGLPPILGYLAAGVLIEPHALGRRVRGRFFDVFYWSRVQYS
jgi:CPA2 family monovalent cation:H+ antiporter-2